MAKMEFDVRLRGADKLVAFFRALDAGVEATKDGDHAKARERFDEADRLRAEMDAGPSHEPMVISVGGELLGSARETGEALARAIAAGDPVDAKGTRCA